MARTSKLTPEIAEALCAALRDGASWEAAAASVGVHVSTVHRWRKRGADARSGRFREFCDAATRAQAEGEASAARQVFRSFMASSTEIRTKTLPDGKSETVTIERPPDPKMALLWLERRFPERWNPRQRLAIGGDDEGGPVRLDAVLRGVDLDALPDDALAALDAFLAALPGDAAP